jgi:hypothetical protein
VLEQLIVPGRNDIGALRLRTVATKDQPCAEFPYKTTDGRYDPSVLLDFDYTVLIPTIRRPPLRSGSGAPQLGQDIRIAQPTRHQLTPRTC